MRLCCYDVVVALCQVREEVRTESAGVFPASESGNAGLPRGVHPETESGPPRNRNTVRVHP